MHLGNGAITPECAVLTYGVAAAGLAIAGGCVLRSITRLIRQYDLRRWHEDVRVLSDSAVVSPVKRPADKPSRFPTRSLRYGETTAIPSPPFAAAHD